MHIFSIKKHKPSYLNVNKRFLWIICVTYVIECAIMRATQAYIKGWKNSNILKVIKNKMNSLLIIYYINSLSDLIIRFWYRFSILTYSFYYFLLLP